MLYQKLARDSDELEIVTTVYGHHGAFKLPNWEEIYLTFKIDTNQIYSVKFDGKQSFNKIDVTNDFNTTKKYKIPKISAPFDASINAVGIDLGTSRCCVAVNRKNGIITVPLDNTGERLLPSYVAFDEEMPKCGMIVVERLRNFSKSTVFDSKRIIGRNIDEIEIDSFWPFNISSKNGRVVLGIHKFNGKGSVSAEEVSGTLLKQIKQKAEEFQGKMMTGAVITIPSAFTEAQKKCTAAAAQLAGWKNIVLLPEPIAATFAYFMDRPIPNKSNILLFDLGGGTLDVCVFKIENEQIQIISNTGDTKLGGRDFDTVLINYFKNALITRYGISLVNIDDFQPNQEGTITINREEFQKMAEPLLNKIRNTIQSALFLSNYKPNQIDIVLQVGGGSRMPMIKNLLKEIFPQAEHCCEEHPDEVVAIGAAYYAYSILLPSASSTPAQCSVQ